MQEAAIRSADSSPLTSVAFDSTGDVVATGSASGRISLYHRRESRPQDDNTDPEAPPSPRSDFRKKNPSPVKAMNGRLWQLQHSFASHEVEFDYLKSVEVEPKINTIRFLEKGCSSSTCLLAANERCLKLWKVKCHSSASFEPSAVAAYSEGQTTAADLKLPTKRPCSTTGSVRATQRRVFKHAHIYHINSLSLSPCEEQFLSADDLQINLWALERSDTCLNFIDLRPDNLEDLSEVITAAVFSPTNSSIIAYSTSSGHTTICDLRQSCLCNTSSAKVFYEPGDGGFFSGITASITAVSFSRDGRLLSTRDYMHVKVWDVRHERIPIVAHKIHEELRPHLSDFYERERIFLDKFSFAHSRDYTKFITGSYAGRFSLRRTEGSLASPVHKIGVYASSPCDELSTGSVLDQAVRRGKARSSVADNGLDDLIVPHCAWHPHQDIVAVTCLSGLYIYNVQHCHV